MQIDFKQPDQSFGISLSAKAIKQLSNIGFSEHYFDILRAHGSKNVILTKKNELSLLPKYKTSIPVDTHFSIKDIAEVIKQNTETLLAEYVLKASRKGQLRKNFIELANDYPQHYDFIKLATEVSLAADDFAIKHPVLNRLKWILFK